MDTRIRLIESSFELQRIHIVEAVMEPIAIVGPIDKGKDKAPQTDSIHLSCQSADERSSNFRYPDFSRIVSTWT